jgi:hypothetical protein
MFEEAHGIFRVELSRTQPKDREPILEDFVSAHTGLPTSRGRDIFEAIIRLQWCNTYVQLCDPSRALEQASKSEDAFD